MKNIMDTVWGHYHDTNLFHLDILDFLGGNILQFLKQVHNYYVSGKLDRKVVGPPLHIKSKMSSKIQISQPPPKYRHIVKILNFPLTFSIKNLYTTFLCYIQSPLNHRKSLSFKSFPACCEK